MRRLCRRWLDAGELKKIRGLFNTEAEKKSAAEDSFGDLFGPELETLAMHYGEGSKARRIANMFKFICPSNYSPGDQKWGAF